MNAIAHEKAAGAPTPAAKEDRGDTNNDDQCLILPAITGIVTLALLITGWTAHEYGYTGTALLCIASAAALQIALECRDRRTRVGQPARMVAPMVRTHGHRRGRMGTASSRHLASRNTRPLREPVDGVVQPGALASFDRRYAHISKERS